ncbi:cytochrome c oxidase subunit cyclope [Megalopta genalis]|uniref:cytochrome c oxidase subunit cyclope n=1 Tax=Megalopta genalis TaxID=115081 RepID=UPI003FD576BD
MSEGRLEKPQLRNLHITYTRRSLGLMLGGTIISGIIYKLAVADPQARQIEEFYKTYNAEASLKKMNDAGLMQSAPK